MTDDILPGIQAREMVGGPNDGRKILTGRTVREVIVPKPASIRAAVLGDPDARLVVGRYVRVDDSNDMVWVGYDDDEGRS